MSIKIAEAIGDRDGRKGESADNEIVIRTFKKRSYEFTQFLRCTDREMAHEAVSYAERIALCPSFGYSQSDRWSGAKSIEAAGKDVEMAQPGDFDCSSFAIECYRLAGCPLKMTGYTGSIRKLLLASGYFCDTDDSDPEYALAGDIFNAPSKHALIVLTDGTKADHSDDEPTIDRLVYVKGENVRIRTGPGKTYPTVKIAHKGETYPYCETDEETGWYWIYTDAGIWCITGNSKYTELR